MARSSARSRSGTRAKAGRADRGGRAIGDLFTRQRLVIGGLTAFAVAFSYVSANAIWYQPHAHEGAFFATRPPASSSGGALAPAAPTRGPEEVETVFRLERPAPGSEAELAPATAARPAPAPVPQPSPTQAGLGGDDQVRDVQAVLARLNLYQGAIDGLAGPQTRTAIEAYQRTVGLEVSGRIDDVLLQQLGAVETVAIPALPSVGPIPGTDQMQTSSSVREDDAIVARIQAGLRAFGHDAIVADGRVGDKTRAALLEFQELFGLPATGRPDPEVYAKMREIGLTN